MKKIFLIGVILLSLAPSWASAQDVVHDGNWWISMGHIAKGYFLIGFKVGVKEASNNPDYDGMEKTHNINIMDGLDLFYKAHQNRDIRFHVAVYIVLKEINKASIDTITKLTGLARANPTKIPEIRK